MLLLEALKQHSSSSHMWKMVNYWHISHADCERVSRVKLLATDKCA